MYLLPPSVGFLSVFEFVQELCFIHAVEVVLPDFLFFGCIAPKLERRNPEILTSFPGLLFSPGLYHMALYQAAP